MGRKSESRSDPELAKAHERGAKVAFVQHAEHGRYGTITYELRRLWKFHYDIAHSGYDQLKRCHEVVLSQPVTPNRDRYLCSDDRPDLTLAVYVAGTQMVLNVILTMQHFCEEIERQFQAEFAKGEIGDRIREAFGLAGIDAASNSAGYAAFREILERRDAIEHPKACNVRNSHPTDWDHVPLSWFLTERAPNSFEQWSVWFSRAVESWQNYLTARGPIMQTFTVTRGVKSTRQYKKPPDLQS
jgi:hypothetical protein